MNVLRRFSRIMRCPVWILRGYAKGTQIPLTLLFGGRAQEKVYFATMFLNENVEQIELGKQWRWMINDLCNRNQCDCTVLPMSRPLLRIFGTTSSFFVPEWVMGVIGTDNRALTGVRRGRLRGDLNRLRKNQLGYETSTSEEDLEYHYNRMYVPYTRASHGEATLLMRYPDIVERFRDGQCDLLFITREQTRIAGGLIMYSGTMPVIKAFGVLDAERQHLKVGAVAARYYFAREHLYKLGFSTLDVGASRAYLKDGVLSYKSKWGLRIIDSSREGFLVTPLNASEGVQQFFKGNPFIYRDKSGLNIAYFGASGETESSVRKQFQEQYSIEGITRINLFTLDKNGGVNKQDGHSSDGTRSEEFDTGV